MGRWVTGDVSLVESEVAATESLEIGHAGVVNGGGPFAVFIGDDELAGGSRKSSSSSRNLGGEKLVTCGIEQPGSLLGKADFDIALFTLRVATKD